jgi:hypothetical protein
MIKTQIVLAQQDQIANIISNNQSLRRRANPPDPDLEGFL